MDDSTILFIVLGLGALAFAAGGSSTSGTSTIPDVPPEVPAQQFELASLEEVQSKYDSIINRAEKLYERFKEDFKIIKQPTSFGRDIRSVDDFRRFNAQGQKLYHEIVSQSNTLINNINEFVKGRNQYEQYIKSIDTELPSDSGLRQISKLAQSLLDTREQIQKGILWNLQEFMNRLVTRDARKTDEQERREKEIYERMSKPQVVQEIYNVFYQTQQNVQNIQNIQYQTLRQNLNVFASIRVDMEIDQANDDRLLNQPRMQNITYDPIQRINAPQNNPVGFSAAPHTQYQPPPNSSATAPKPKRPNIVPEDGKYGNLTDEQITELVNKFMDRPKKARKLALMVKTRCSNILKYMSNGPDKLTLQFLTRLKKDYTEMYADFLRLQVAQKVEKLPQIPDKAHITSLLREMSEKFSKKYKQDLQKYMTEFDLSKHKTDIQFDSQLGAKRKGMMSPRRDNTKRSRAGKSEL